MSRLMPADIRDDVRAILKKAATGKGPDKWFLTAYQILNRLPPAIRQRLIEERSLGGAGTGKSYSAVTVVSQAADGLGTDIEKQWLDTRGLSIDVAGRAVKTGYEVTAIYRLQ